MAKKTLIACFCCLLYSLGTGATPECSDYIIKKGYGKTRDAASKNADEQISKDISSTLEGIYKDSLEQIMQGGVVQREKNISKNVAVLKVSFDGVKYIKQIAEPYKDDGEWVSERYICKSDAAKPYLEKQRILADEMKIAKDWNKIKNNWNEFRDIQILLEGLRVESKYLASAKKSYEEAKDRCTAKLHWNPENKTAYSDIAFSKLSGIGMETSECKGKGIKLAYNGDEAKCRKAGMYQCIHKPSLTISSCKDGKDEKHRLLEGDEIKVYEKTEEAALETLQESLRNGTFWNKWEQEIKQWRPKCD